MSLDSEATSDPLLDPVYGPAGFTRWAEEGLIEQAPFWSCECGNTNRLLHLHFADYFHDLPVTCSRCELPSNLWAQISQRASRGDMLSFYSVVGGRMSARRVEWPRDSADELELSLDEMQIPDDALFLYYYFAPTTSTPGMDFDPDDHELLYGGTRVLLDHGGGGPIPRPGLPRTLKFVKARIDPRKQIDDVRVTVVWVPRVVTMGSWGLLINAAQSYRSAQSRAAIVSANAAVESAVRFLFEEMFTRETTADVARTFLTDAATYSHQLNALTPALMVWRGWPKLPDDLRGKLNRLRRLRNQNAHGSVESVDWREIADLIISALFALHYFFMVQETEGCFDAPWQA